MADPVRETRRLSLGKGCVMRFMVDESKATDDLRHHWTETSYDGRPESWVPDIGSHWHKYHDEYMEILEGEIDFVLDGKAVTLHAGDPSLHIPKCHVHSFKFKAGVKSVLIERTDPVGDFKEKFFEVLLDERITDGGKPSLLSVMLSFYDGDTFLGLPGGFKLLEENLTWLLSVLGKLWAPNGPRVQPGAVPMNKKTE
ncbi:hypothetical protein HII31_10769 [Pseudocercospora fuligena]|uniref:Cupin type-2 domain-containing protein n=1 Tax=Pseudocercospora fuligena TaxID=685502 RepID=A0A8H6RA45_9PEZI|nr:hypothetical protein HII31_10769 [Pseudocercospora fuligena]